jgi:hypothetical protein
VIGREDNPIHWHMSTDKSKCASLLAKLAISGHAFAFLKAGTGFEAWMAALPSAIDFFSLWVSDPGAASPCLPHWFVSLARMELRSMCGKALLQLSLSVRLPW